MESSLPVPDSLGKTPRFDLPDRSRPRHHFFTEEVQFRAKVQRYSSAPEEVTLQKISFDRDVDRYRRAAELGLSHVPIGGGKRVEKPVRDDESLERSQRRAKTRVRKLVMELAPEALVTFTTRAVVPLDDLLDIWERFRRLGAATGLGLEYVAVPEPHPSNPEHLHIHAAMRGSIGINTLRRLWHMAIEAHFGRRVTSVLRGKESPGNIDVQRIKGRDAVRRMRKIARYISKYITKGMIQRFNRRRYWQSRGISLAAAEVYWLDSLSQADALREACRMLGHWVTGEDGTGAPLYRMFRPCDRVAWWCAEPDEPPVAPF